MRFSCNAITDNINMRLNELKLEIVKVVTLNKYMYTDIIIKTVILFLTP